MTHFSFPVGIAILVEVFISTIAYSIARPDNNGFWKEWLIGNAVMLTALGGAAIIIVLLAGGWVLVEQLTSGIGH